MLSIKNHEFFSIDVRVASFVYESVTFGGRGGMYICVFHGIKVCV